MEFRNASNQVFAWFTQRRRKALEAAYEGALTIQKLEVELFDGQKITDAPDKSKTVADYAASLRDRQLLKIRFNLTQFKANSFLFDTAATAPPVEAKPDASEDEVQRDREPVLAQLEFIESVVAKYRTAGNTLTFLTGDAALDTPMPAVESMPVKEVTLDPPMLAADRDRPRESFLPRLRSPNKETESDYEQQLIGQLRLQRQQNRVALRWLAVLLIIPLSIQILTRNLLFEPLMGSYSNVNPTEISLSEEIQEEFAREYLFAKEKLEVATLLGYYDEMNDEIRQAYLQESAFDIWREARESELNGLKNLLADVIAFVVFVGLVLVGRRQVNLIRAVSNRTFLNLRDPMKVFLFILITDIFVGFHSADVW